MPKWHFGVVLDFDEYQTLGITMIMHVYHVLIIGCVFYTLWSKCASSCLDHISHMHTSCTLDAHTYSLVMFWTSLMLDKCCYMFSTYNMIVWHWLCSVLDLVFVLWTNLVQIKFVFLFRVFVLVPLCLATIFADVSYQAFGHKEVIQASTL